MTKQKILVSAASRHGATGEISDAIAAVLRERGHEVQVQRPDEVVSLTEYSVVILGSAVYLGHWLKPATRLVDRFINELATRTVYLFSSGPVGDPPFPATPPSDINGLMVKTVARAHATFAGRMSSDDLGAGERVAVRFSHATYGDFRDWLKVDAWATRIADDLEGIRLAAVIPATRVRA